MVEILSLLVLVIALATGLLCSMFIASRPHTGQPVFFRYLLTNILLFNLLVLSGLVFRYLQFKLHSPGLSPYLFVIPWLLTIMTAIKLAWLYVFFMMNEVLPADVASAQTRTRLASRTLLAVFLAYLGMTVVAFFWHREGLLQAATYAVETIVLGGALASSARLVSKAVRLGAGSRRISVLLFGTFHLVLLCLVLLVLFASWLWPGPQKLPELLTYGGFLILFNSFPLLWIPWFRPLQSVAEPEKFSVFGITRREKEIIGLIQQGKTNQEIGSILNISVATVKDHNHNIFRKTGVRNRMELSNLFR